MRRNTHADLNGCIRCFLPNKPLEFPVLTTGGRVLKRYLVGFAPPGGLGVPSAENHEPRHHCIIASFVRRLVVWDRIMDALRRSCAACR